MYQAAVALERNNRNPIFVQSHGRPVGILTEDDIVAKVLATGQDPRTVSVGDIMEAGAVSGDGRALLVEDVWDVTSPLHHAEPISKMVDLEPRRGHELAQRGQCEECETDQEFLYELEGMVLCEDCFESHEAGYA